VAQPKQTQPAAADPENVHFTHTEGTLFNADGAVSAGQARKFAPKIRAIRKLLGPRPDAGFLDVGVGYGVFLHMLEKHGYRRIAGMDPFPKSLEIARQHTSADLKLGRIEDERWPFRPGEFDVISSFDVVEHLHEPAVFLRRCREYLAPDGLVVLSTPNRSVFYEMRRIPLIGYPDRNPTHINVHRPRYWLRLAREEGYEVVAKWYGEVMAHIRYLPQFVEVVSNYLDVDLEKAWFLRGLQQSLCLVLRRA